MKTVLKKTLLAAAMALPALPMSAAQAGPTFTNGLNDIYVTNAESLFRTDAQCAAVGGCLGAGTGPSGWQTVNTAIANNTRVGDVFAGVFNVQNITNDASGVTSWFQGATDQFSGYFSQQIAAVYPAGSDPYNAAQVNDAHLVLNAPTVDPFGRLGAGQMYQLYYQSGGGTTVFTKVGTFASTIATATDGTLWATLGAGAGIPVPGTAPLNGYAYTHADLTQTQLNIVNTSLQALNVITTGGAFNLPNIHKINDVNENEVGGVGPVPSTGQCVSSNTTTCTDFIGTVKVTFNTGFLTGQSPWTFDSNDPFQVYVPEPATVALMGLGLFGMAGVRRRAKKRS
jgi:hypothetical protein